MINELDRWQRISLFRKIILALAKVHLDRAISEKDDNLEPEMVNMSNVIDFHLKAIRFTQEEAKIIDNFEKQNILKHITQIGVNSIHFTMRLLSKLISSKAYNNILIFNKKQRAKIKLYGARVLMSKKNIKDKKTFDEVYDDTNKVVEYVWNRHSMILGIEV